MQNATPALHILRNGAELSLESRVRGKRARTVWEGGDGKGPTGTSSAPHFIDHVESIRNGDLSARRVRLLYG